MKKIEDLFGLDRTKTYTIIVISVIFVLAMIKQIMRPEEKQHWQIKHNGKYHLTIDPVVTGNCVEFTDENGQSHKICGSYSMKRI